MTSKYLDPIITVASTAREDGIDSGRLLPQSLRLVATDAGAALIVTETTANNSFQPTRISIPLGREGLRHLRGLIDAHLARLEPAAGPVEVSVTINHHPA